MKPNRELNSPRVDVMMNARMNFFVGAVYHGDCVRAPALVALGKRFPYAAFST